jgi:hypothetical protein
VGRPADRDAVRPTPAASIPPWRSTVPTAWSTPRTWWRSSGRCVPAPPSRRPTTRPFPAGVVMISPASTSPALSELDDNDLVFRTVPSDAYQGEMLARSCSTRASTSDRGHLRQQRLWQAALSDAFSEAFEAGGGTVAENLRPTRTARPTTGPSSAPLAASGAETLVVLAYVDTSGQTMHASGGTRAACSRVRRRRRHGGRQPLIEAAGAGNLDGMIADPSGLAPTCRAPISTGRLAEDAGLDPDAVFGAQAMTPRSCWRWPSRRTAGRARGALPGAARASPASRARSSCRASGRRPSG